MPLRDLKEGFERLSMIAFVVVAAIFGAVYLVANEPYLPPAPESDAGRAIQHDIDRECGAQEALLMVRLCREQVRARHRWHHYVDKVGPDKVKAVAVVAAVVAGAFGIWAFGWVRKGFRSD